MKMPRRIIYYAVFVTLLWSVFAENEEKIRNTFNNNVTRADFGNLLQSLIKLNEQRVNVLQKLYKLEDYGVISEVLRSGNTKAANGNKNNLLLVVLSKNESATTRRLMDAHVVESIPSLDIKTNTINNNPVVRSISKKYQEKQKHYMEPAPVISNDPNTRQDHFELFLEDEIPEQIKIRNRFEIDDGKHKHAISNRVRGHDRNPKVGVGEMDIDNKINPISDQGRVEDERNEIALDSLKIDGDGENHNKKVKDRFEIDDGSGNHAKSSFQRLEIGNHNQKYPTTLKDMRDADDHISIYPEKGNDDLDNDNNKYSKSAKDMNQVDYHTKYRDTLKDNDNAYHQSSKYPKTENDDLDDHNNKNTEPDMYGGGDNSHKVPNMLKTMYDKEDYPKLSIETYSETKKNTQLRKDKSEESKSSEFKSNFNGFEENDAIPESRKNLQKCIGKKALKLCTKSCNTAYQNVCRRLKCTSRSKKSLKKECKKSCTASFSTGSKYSSET